MRRRHRCYGGRNGITKQEGNNEVRDQGKYIRGCMNKSKLK